MNLRANTMTIAEAKTMDLIHYLACLGFNPSRVRGDDFWFLSPLRQENTPSFKINQRLNCWYDHGIGKGGTIIEFGLLYYGCSLPELLQNLTGSILPVRPHINDNQTQRITAPKIMISKVAPLASRVLLHYLEQRKIPTCVAREFCVEVTYTLNGSTYFGIGFKNDLGGYEIRNPYFKSGSSPKGLTTYDNKSDEVVVFEGFIDFLSFKAMNTALERKPNFVILNSLAFFEKALPFLERHQVVRLFLDRDQPGLNCTKQALALGSKYKDESLLYKDYKDLNNWAMAFGKTDKNNLGRKFKL